jgi:hypothetical protein
MGCQTAIAEKIREQKADYVLSVKENQPELYHDIKDYFDLVEERWERSPSSGGGRRGSGAGNLNVLVDRGQSALVPGRMFWWGTRAGRSGESEHPEKNSVVSPAKRGIAGKA